MDTSKWLRPNFRRLLRFVMFFLACVWLSAGGFTLYAYFWWPDHGILDNTPAEWLAGMTGVSLLFATIFALSWLQDRRVTWRVGPAGIAVYRGNALRRSFAWSEVESFRVLSFGANALLVTRPLIERLPWLTVTELSWLREFARQRLGESRMG